MVKRKLQSSRQTKILHYSTCVPGPPVSDGDECTERLYTF